MPSSVARILAVGVYLADRPNTAAHVFLELASSQDHEVIQRWIAIAPQGRGRYDLPLTRLVMTETVPKFALVDRLACDAHDFDWLLICDDDIEMGPGFVDRLIKLSELYDFSVSQPARTVDSFTDHPIVQVMPGLIARRTRFVEVGPLVCVRSDAMPILLPFGPDVGMGWGLDLVWPVRLERARLRMGILDAVPLAHRLRPQVSAYDADTALREYRATLAREEGLSMDEAFTILEAYC
jgi:hypothetical protein